MQNLDNSKTGDMFLKIFQASPDGYIISRISDGKILRVNRSAEIIYGYKEEEMLGGTSTELGLFADRRDRDKAIGILKENGFLRDFSIYIVRKTGEKRFVSLAVEMVDLDGEQCMLTSVRDITDQKKAEEALQKSELRFRTFVTATSEVLYRMSPDWSKMLVLTGHGFLVDTENENPNWLQEYIHPDDQPHVMAAINEAIKNKSTFELEHRVRQADGSWGWTYSRAVPLLDAEGKIIEWFGAAIDFTKRRQAEEELEIREAQLDAFFANSPAILNLVDENFCYINTDEITPTYYGLNRETIKGKCVKDLSQDFIEQTGKVMQHIIETGEPVLNEQFQAPVPGRGGEMAYWSTSMFRVPLGNEKWGVGVISVEITDIKRAEAKLAESEERFVKAFDNSPYAMTITKLPEGIWTDVNASFINLTGFSREELIGHTSVELGLVIEQSPQDRRRIIKSLAETGSVTDAEMTIRTKYGKLRHVILSAVITKLNNENFAITQHVDLTERKNAESEVRKAKEEYELLFNSIHEGFAHYKAVYDETGRLDDILVLEINPSGAVLSGVPRDKQLGKRWKEVWTGIEDFLFDNYRQVDQTGETLTFEHLSVITNRWYITNIYKIADGEFAVTFIDINDRKITEINLNKTLSELERSNKDLERFAYAASHDLQEPIRMMGSYAHLLTKKYKGRLDNQADMYLEFIFEGAQRLRLLIRDLLNYDRLRTNKMTFSRVDLNTLLTAVLEDLNKSINETGARIKYGPLPEIDADRDQLKQLFSNLLSNAIKFRKNGTAPVINIFSENRGKEWLFLVEDNGIGIEPEFTKLIFNVFQRLNNRETYPGVGIGLAICKRIVERHEGSIWVESEPGKGSKFFFTIPKKESEALK